ncbi:hypothetical protein [Gordonia sp. OPL2]|uniref:hypothetical protein n=1 Tax=Gordonia sp. OPL2 TaxID=2486274 RepID=UPI001655A195|nr:hypothetical protein [Gordonia sp. OPL2]
MYQLIVGNLGTCVLAAAGLILAAAILVDNVRRAFANHDHLVIRNGKIVESEGGRR